MEQGIYCLIGLCPTTKGEEGHFGFGVDPLSVSIVMNRVYQRNQSHISLP